MRKWVLNAVLICLVVALPLISNIASAKMVMGTNFWHVGWQQRQMFADNVNWATTTNPWNPEFLSELSVYKVLRPMDWVPTNNSNITDWSQRVKKTDDHYSSNGVAYEWQIDLCNRLGADLWVTIPHQANYDYSIHLAQLVKDNLDPKLKVYIEYSNETWNFGFQQAEWCKNQGVALGLAENQYTAGFIYHTYAAVRHFAGWDQVFAGQSNRYVKVLAGQTGNSWLAGVHLDALNDAQINPVHVQVDAYAVAPYFGHDATTFSELQAAMQKAVTNSNAVYNEVHGRGYPLYAYEGGQHVYKSNADGVNRNAGMYQLYKDYFDAMNPYYDIFCHYNHRSVFHSGGAWGATEYVGQPLADAHKFRAIIEWTGATPIDPPDTSDTSDTSDTPDASDNSDNPDTSDQQDADGQAQTTALTPVADRDNQSDNAAGTNSILNISQWCNSYFKFDLADINSVENARFKLYRLSAEAATINVYQASDSWSEDGTVPGLGPLITSVSSNASGYVSIDLTDYVRAQAAGDGTATIAVGTNMGNWNRIGSRESANKPKLDITTESTTDPATDSQGNLFPGCGDSQSSGSGCGGSQ